MESADGHVSRRELLKRGLALGGALTFSSIVQTRNLFRANPAVAAPAIRRGGALAIAIESNNTSLDPQTNYAGIDRMVYPNIYDPLVRIDENLNLKPGLAENWEIPSPTVYVFHLRRGVKFHDGTDFTAEDVKYQFEWALDSKNASPSGTVLDTIKQITILDPHTIKVELKRAHAPFLVDLVDTPGYIYSKAARVKYGKDTTRNPVGTGPFKFVEWIQDDHVTLRRFEGYWEKDASGSQLPYLEELVVKPVVDNTVKMAAIKSGELQFLWSVDHKDVPRIKAESNLQYYYTPGMGFQDGWIQCAKGVFADKHLRKAVAWAIDREELIRVVSSSVGQVAHGTVPPKSWAFDPNFKPWRRDLTKAKEELRLGGKPNGFEFELICETAKERVQKAELIQAQLAAVGIKAKINKMEFGRLLDNLGARSFDLILVGQSSRLDPHTNLRQIFRSDGVWDFGNYKNPKVDALIDEARATLDQNKRKQLYHEIDRIISVEDAAYIFTNFWDNNQVARKEVQGYVIYPDGAMRFHRVWLAK